MIQPASLSNSRVRRTQSLLGSRAVACAAASACFLAYSLESRAQISTAPVPAAPVPVHELVVQTVSPLAFSNIFQVRQIAGGAVLVNDALRRQLTLLDGSLKLSRVVLDSITSAAGEGYGTVATPLIAYRGDSSLMVDRESRALLLIDPNGKVVRTLSSPTTPKDFANLYSSTSVADPAGNLLLRAELPTVTKRIGVATASSITEETRQPDSTFILRVNFSTGNIDTVARIKQTVGMHLVNTHDPNVRSPLGKFKVNPIETLDDWTMLADGTVAVVRGADYHVDFIALNGAHTSSAKLPFDWKEISDTDKQRIIDSTKMAVDAAGDKARPNGAMAELDARREALIGHAMRLPGSPPIPARVIPTLPGQVLPKFEYEFVPLDEMPSYYPPLRIGFTKGDADGNLWILPSTSAQSKAGELVYDVVNNKGVLYERVRMPLGRLIAGFGVGGVVYLRSVDANGTWHLERGRVVP